MKQATPYFGAWPGLINNEGAYISNQVRMHGCHLTPKHYINVFEIL
jgi:hypothetical protein